jgi:hypothetical protein
VATCGMKVGGARRSTRGRATVNMRDESGTRAARGSIGCAPGSVGDQLAGPGDGPLGDV